MADRQWNRVCCFLLRQAASENEFQSQERVDQISNYYCNLKWKASFNNVKSEKHGLTCYQCLWYGVILKPYITKLRFKMIMKCLKKVKFFEWPVLPYSFSPIDCSVIKTVRKTQNLISMSNHKYLDNQTGDLLVKVMGFLTDLKVHTTSDGHVINPIFFPNRIFLYFILNSKQGNHMMFEM